MFVNDRHPKGGGVIYKINNLDPWVTNKSYICILIPAGFLELFKSTEIDRRPVEEFRQDFTGVPGYSTRENKKQVLVLAP